MSNRESNARILVVGTGKASREFWLQSLWSQGHSICVEKDCGTDKIRMRHENVLRIKHIGEIIAVESKSGTSLTARFGSFKAKLRSFISRYLFLPERSEKEKPPVHETQMFFDASTAWITSYSNARRQDVDRATLINGNMLKFAYRHDPCEKNRQFSLFIDHLRNGYTVRHKVPGEHFKTTYDEFDGLILYLAVRFKGSVNWLGKDEIDRDALLLPSIYEAVRSSIAALFECAEELPYLDIEGQLQRRVVTEQLRQYGLGIKQHDLGNLKACLVRTPFASNVYLNKRLPRQLWVMACFHELGHYVLRHRSNSEYGLDPEVLTSAGLKDQFIRQEEEADGFAELWSHVLHGLIEYFLSTAQKISAPKFQITTDSKGSGPSNAPALQDATPSKTACIS